MKNSFKLGALALVLSLSVVACGGNKTTSSTDSTSTTKVDTTVKTTVDTTAKVDSIATKDTTKKM